MDCPEHHTILAFLQGSLSPEKASELEQHFDSCLECHGQLVALVRDPALLAQLPETPPPPSEVPASVAARAKRASERGGSTAGSEARVLLGSKFSYEETDTAAASSHGSEMAFQTGAMVEHFEVMRPLGAGGMGQVYLARDTKLGRRVALKVLHAELLSTPQAAEWFQREARTTARFNHPNIVTIHGVGEHNGTPYVALEYVPGQTLKERMRERWPSPTEGLRLILPVVQALREAHEHGVLHRDLKPSNILIGSDGRVRVLDFGLAKILEGETAAIGAAVLGGGLEGSRLETTRGTSQVGTPAYMAPEQWRGRPSSRATDLWGLGVVIYELLAGERPFQAGDLGELLQLVCSDEPAPLLPSGKHVPQVIVGLVSRCLDKSADRRPSASEAAETIERALAARGDGLDERRSPFRGLLPFREYHAELFFGREAEIAELVERVRLHPVIAVVGPSGAGKSSFIQAGVIPRLREQERWLVLWVRPGPRPFVALASALMRQESRSSASVSGPSERSGDELMRPSDEASAIADELRAGGRHAVLLRLRALARQQGCKVLLYVDQLEEIFTLAGDTSRAEIFMSCLSAAADDPHDPVRVIFTVRDDFLNRVTASADARGAMTHVSVLHAPTHDALVETLVGPLGLRDYHFDDKTLPTEMVAQVRGEPACLPLLEFAAQMLWDRRDQVRHVLLRSEYEAIGGVEGALAKHADGVLASLSERQLHLTRNLLLRLVTPERTRKLVTRQHALAGLGSDDGDVRRAMKVLDILVDARLITVSRPRRSPGEGPVSAGDARLELAHESLVETWGTLARWIDEGVDDLRFIADLQQVAELWDRRGRLGDELWQERALSEAAAALRRSEAELPPLARQFIDAARSRRRQRQRGRQLALASGATLLVALATVFGFQKQDADKAAARAKNQQRQSETLRAEALQEGARAALARQKPLESRARLRGALEIADARLARALWWQLGSQPLLWRVPNAGSAPVAISPDGRTVAYGDFTGTVHRIDAATSLSSAVGRHQGALLSLAYSPDGSLLAAGDEQGAVRVWRRDGGSEAVLEWPGRIWTVNFDHQGKRLVTAGDDGAIQIWDRASWTRTKTLQGHDGAVRAARFSPDGRHLASVGDDGTVRLWDLSGDPIGAKVLGHHAAGARDVRFSPDGKLVASAGKDGMVLLWDSATGLPTLKLFHPAELSQIAFSRTGELVASGGHDGTIKLWRLADGLLHRDLDAAASPVTGLDFGPGGRLAAVADGVRLYDTTMPAQRVRNEGHVGRVLSVAFSPDGRLIASGGADEAAWLWASDSGAPVGVLRGHKQSIRALRFDRDGGRLATAGDDGAVILWRVATQSELSRLSGHEGTVSALAFSPDDKTLASAGYDRKVRLWQLGTGALSQLLGGSQAPIHSVAFSPDGKLLATAGRSPRVVTWDLATGAAAFAVTTPEREHHQIRFSPEGSSLLMGGSKGSLRLWQLGADTQLIASGTGSVFDVGFNASGHSLAAAGSDGVTVFDSSGRTELTLHDHEGPVRALAFAPTEQRIATAGDDGMVRLHETAKGHPLWHTTGILGSPPWLLNHLGWQPLASQDGKAPKLSQALKKTLVEDAIQARQGPGGSVCVARHDGRLEVWQAEGTAPAATHASTRSSQLVAASEGCLTLSRGQASFTDMAGNTSEFVAEEDATAIALYGGGSTASPMRALVATTKSLFVFDRQGKRLKMFPIGSNVSHLRAAGQLVYLGHEDGHLAVLNLAGGGKAVRLALDQLPTSSVSSILPGPMKTLAVGFANGTVGLWDPESRRLLRSERLHGRIEHLVADGATLYIASQLGRHLSWNLVTLQRPYCELLREVWASVPVVWQQGRPVVRPAPARHDCALPPK